MKSKQMKVFYAKVNLGDRKKPRIETLKFIAPMSGKSIVVFFPQPHVYSSVTAFKRDVTVTKIWDAKVNLSLLHPDLDF